MKELPWGRMPDISIYNTLSRREEKFPPPDEHPVVSIYVCGPTTYQFVHVGNMRNPVLYDVIRKIFRAHGYRVVFVTNFTDVDDKMIAEAKKAGEADPLQWSARFVHEYYTDLFALGVAPADYFPKVSTHIPEIIEYIQKILENGHGYVGSDGSVYFDVSSYPDYLRLSGKKMEDLLGESRQDESAKAKRDPRDFALWKKARPGEPEWPSPWGNGRPGWHIECSVMSSKYLGRSFDIHGGGHELKFPHHENELAQAKCFDPDSDFARIWIHNEWVTWEGEKMAKSGKSLRIRDVLRDENPESMRLFLLSAHYRKAVDFSFEKLGELDKARGRILEAFRSLTMFLRWRAEERKENWLLIWKHWDDDRGVDRELFSRQMTENVPVEKMTGSGTSPAEILVENIRRSLWKAHRAFADDFNTQGAIGELFEMVTAINTGIGRMKTENEDDRDAANIALGGLMYLCDIIGILKKENESLYRTEEERSSTVSGSGESAKLADVLLKIRNEARQEKNFELADKIRDYLASTGAEIRDTPKGSEVIWD